MYSLYFVLQVNKEIDAMKEFQALKRESDEKIIKHEQIIKARLLAFDTVDNTLKIKSSNIL